MGNALIGYIERWELESMKQAAAAIAIALVCIIVTTSPAMAHVVTAQTALPNTGTGGINVVDAVGAIANLGAVAVLGALAREFMRGRIKIADPVDAENRLVQLIEQQDKRMATLEGLVKSERERADVFRQFVNKQMGLD